MAESKSEPLCAECGKIKMAHYGPTFHCKRYVANSEPDPIFQPEAAASVPKAEPTNTLITGYYCEFCDDIHTVGEDHTPEGNRDRKRKFAEPSRHPDQVCSWCKTNASEAAARHEGPHATWCPHFRENQRGGHPDQPFMSAEEIDKIVRTISKGWRDYGTPTMGQCAKIARDAIESYLLAHKEREK